MNATTTAVADLIGPVLSRLAGLAPRPVSLEATGLAPEMLADLVLKQLLRGGSLTSAVLGERLGLVGPVLDPIVQFLRQEGRLQLQARASFDNEVRLSLTERGRQSAQDALQRARFATSSWPRNSAIASASPWPPGARFSSTDPPVVARPTLLHG